MRNGIRTVVFVVIVLVLITGISILITDSLIKVSASRSEHIDASIQETEPLWTLPANTVVYRNVDWLNNNICYVTMQLPTGDNFSRSGLAISCVSMVK